VDTHHRIWPWRLRLGDFALWRLTHVVLGIIGMVGLFVHTGGRLGSNLDFVLMICFSLLLLPGGASKKPA
jgi:nitrite reductase (NADH) large subunit